jgi:ornithine cyclodeaminase
MDSIQMTKVISLEEINEILKKIDPIKEIEEGFIEFSRGNVVVPPVGEMIFEDPPGEAHIKYGFIKKDAYYVIKIASGFYNNPKIGLPSYDGLMLLFNQKTGELVSVMLDKGHLTNVRTAAAGAVVAKYFKPKKVNRIGIFGAGVQGKMQLEYLRGIVDCKDVIVWGLSQEELDLYKKDMSKQSYFIETTMESEDITSTCNFIITCTPAKKPLIIDQQIEKGIHITAMGSDTPEKQEIDTKILAKADRVIVDSLAQAQSRGESYQALKAGLIKKENLIELGHAILNNEYHRQSDDELTIADLTGVAVQDIQITKAIWKGIAPKQ